jgi:hypothetical protein
MVCVDTMVCVSVCIVVSAKVRARYDTIYYSPTTKGEGSLHVPPLLTPSPYQASPVPYGAGWQSGPSQHEASAMPGSTTSIGTSNITGSISGKEDLSPPPIVDRLSVRKNLFLRYLPPRVLATKWDVLSLAHAHRDMELGNGAGGGTEAGCIGTARLPRSDTYVFARVKH